MARLVISPTILYGLLTAIGQSYAPKAGPAPQTTDDDNEAAVREFQAAVCDLVVVPVCVCVGSISTYDLFHQFKRTVSSYHEPSAVVSSLIVWQLVICL